MCQWAVSINRLLLKKKKKTKLIITFIYKVNKSYKINVNYINIYIYIL